MTKLKEPRTIDTALATIAVQLGGWAAMADICGCHVATCYRWADPDTDNSVPFNIAVRLDIAYERAGGRGRPLLSVFQLLLDEAAHDPTGTRHDLAYQAMATLKETAEATSAHIRCTLPDATPDDFRTAIRETKEAQVAIQTTLAILEKGAGPIDTGRVTPGEGTGK